MHDEAIAVVEDVGARDRGWLLGRQLALAGRTEEARAIATELEPQGDDPWIAFNLAMLYATLGDADKTIHWLNAERIHCWASWARVVDGYEFLYDDPRFAEFMEKRNLPWPRSADE
jgi:hypothetical protein